MSPDASAILNSPGITTLFPFSSVTVVVSSNLSSFFASAIGIGVGVPSDGVGLLGVGFPLPYLSIAFSISVIIPSSFVWAFLYFSAPSFAFSNNPPSDNAIFNVTPANINKIIIVTTSAVRIKCYFRCCQKYMGLHNPLNKNPTLYHCE